MTTTTRISGPDQSARSLELIELWSALDPEAQDAALARLIAAAIHPGIGSALERFAGTGRLSPDAALQELNNVRVPWEREGWVDLLGRFILSGTGAE